MKKLLLITVPVLLLAACEPAKAPGNPNNNSGIVEYTEPTNEVASDVFFENFNSKLDTCKFYNIDKNNPFDWVGIGTFSELESGGIVSNGTKIKQEDNLREGELHAECDIGNKIMNYSGSEKRYTNGTEKSSMLFDQTIFVDGMTGYYLKNDEKKYFKQTMPSEEKVNDLITSYFEKYLNEFVDETFEVVDDYLDVPEPTCYIDSNVYTLKGNYQATVISCNYNIQFTLDDNRFSCYFEISGTEISDNMYIDYTLSGRSDVQAKEVTLSKPSLEGYTEG